MKWLIRIPIHLMKWLFIKIPMQLLGMIVLAPLLLFIPRDKEYLPKYFKWFDNADYYRKPKGSQIDGLSGDPGYRNQFKDPTGWWARYCWLALRNPINYFQYYKLGVAYELGNISDISYSGNRFTSDWIRKGGSNNSGLFVAEVRIRNRTYWELYWVFNWSDDRCLRLRLGWKINQVPEKSIYDQVVENRHFQFTFNLHPYKEIQDRSR